MRKSGVKEAQSLLLRGLLVLSGGYCHSFGFNDVDGNDDYSDDDDDDDDDDDYNDVLARCSKHPCSASPCSNGSQCSAVRIPGLIIINILNLESTISPGIILGGS